MKKLITVMLVLGLTATAAASNIGKAIQLGIDGQVLDEVTLDVSDSFTMSFILADGWDMDAMELRLVITSLGGAGHVELPYPPESIVNPCFDTPPVHIVPDGLIVAGMSFAVCTGVIVDDIQFHCDGAGDVQVQIIDVGTNNSPTQGDISQDMMGSIIIRQVLHPVDRFVPDHYPTIQAAIDAAVDGDSVIVAEDVYTGSGNKNLDFRGKAITVRSTNPQDPCVVAATVIDCQNSGRGFYFHTGEDANSILSGFTITRGNVSHGGAVYCTAASPTIENCVIADNKAYGVLEAYGGGIYCTSGSNPTVVNCTISDNQARGADAVDFGSGRDAYGGGIYGSEDSLPEILNCTIIGNTATGGLGFGGIVPPPPRSGDGYGGGICANATIDNCIISNNAAVGGNTEDGVSQTFGGGIYGIVTITNSIVTGNTAFGGSYGEIGPPLSSACGGGIFARTNSSIANCLIA
ncbi:MAG: right-handed parallel beta-helix repeat-containing protein, partial [Planctomycetota bacterium]